MTTTVFLDRDGVINKESERFVKNWSEFIFLPESLKAFKMFEDAGIQVIVVTNQSAIARKLTTLSELEEIHANLISQVEYAGGRITGIYYCPHGPADGCSCRKPEPGLIWDACRDHGIDPSTSFLVGDSLRDIRSGQSAGCKTVLVRTGNGRKTEKQLAGEGIRCDAVTDDLLAAASWIIGQCGNRPS